MSVKKLSDGQWLCDFRINGRNGQRIRKRFVTRGEALSFERTQINKYKHTDLPINDQRLSDLIVRWYDLYGKTLTSGKKRLTYLNSMCERLGDPFAQDIDKNMFVVYRQRRLNGEWLPKGKKVLKEATVNREQSYLHAIFSELKRLGEWEAENPISGIRKFKEGDQELAFLYDNEIKHLLAECDKSDNPDLIHVVRVCLATGARWSEAQDLTQPQLIPHKITFTQTKSKKNRTVPISKQLYDLLPKKRGRLFTPCYDAFRSALKRSDISLPQGQLTHVLRHTFASHFMMRGGNILVLQQILGHSSIMMTMRYAHFAPDHLDAAVNLNPYDNLD